jgi:hypothetical protein
MMLDRVPKPMETPPNSKISEQPIKRPSLDSNDSAMDAATDSTTALSNTADTATNCAKSDATPFPLMKLAPELRIKIYRHYFEDFASSKGTYHTTMWTAAHQKHLSLLQSSSQVRREAAPIFYKEYLANEGSDSTHRWMLGSERLTRMQNRVEALRQFAAQYYSDVEVSPRYMPPHFGSKRVDTLVLVR